jgi:uncharacterized damage-inducible protein DinB
MSIEDTFLTEAADKLAENLSRIEVCVPKLPADALWAHASENENAVGNLLLHLEGNVRQWILSGLGGTAEHRDRPAEFAARSGPAAAVLVANLRQVVNDAIDLIRSLPHARLNDQVTIQGYNTTVLAAIFHVVEHFSGHTYQIILITKYATHEDLGFYGYLGQTGRKETR